MQPDSGASANVLVERYRRWFAYEKDAHAKVVESLRAVSEDLRGRPEYRAAVDLLAHVAAARHMWLYRFGVLPEPPDTPFPREADLEALVGRLGWVQDAWSAYLDRVSDHDIVQTFEYTSLDGQHFRNTYDDILAQLFGHSSYHRGQIAARLRAIGAEPAVTDFVIWAREPL